MRKLGHILLISIVIYGLTAAPYLRAQEKPIQPLNASLLSQIAETLEAVKRIILFLAAAITDSEADTIEVSPVQPTTTPISKPSLTPLIQQPVSQKTPTLTVTDENKASELIESLKRQVADLRKEIRVASQKAPPTSLNPNPAIQFSPSSFGLEVGQREKKPRFAPGSLLVQFKDGFGPNSDTLHELNLKFKLKSSQELFPRHRSNTLLSNIYVLGIAEDADIGEAVAAYRDNSAVKFAEPNLIANTTAIQQPPVAPEIPNDPLYPQQWHLPKISAPDAWAIETGKPSTVIAVIDTGVYWRHPDLAANIWKNPGEIPNNGKDDDNNGFIDDDQGWDFVETTDPSCSPGEDCLVEDNNPDDYFGHGTHVAGIAAAVTNNKIGIASICQNCKIMNVRAGYAVGNPTPYGGGLEYDDIVQSIVYAADNGAKIINMSFRGGDSSTLHLAIKYAYGKGVNLVAAAGNDFSRYLAYPAGYNETIAVGATDNNDKQTSFTNYGNWIDIAAPGEDIISTVVPGVTWGCRDTLSGYGSCSGTSMASPIVAGITGLILSKNAALAQNQVLTLIHSSYDPVKPSFSYLSDYLGLGRINAYKAVTPSQIPVALFTRVGKSPYVTAAQLNISGTASGQNFEKYSIEYGESWGSYPSSWNSIQRNQIQSVINGTLATWQLVSRSIPPGYYPVRLALTDKSGKVWEDRTYFIVDTTIHQGWPKDIPPHRGPISPPVFGIFYGYDIFGPTLFDVDRDGDGEMFFHTLNSETHLYAIDHQGSLLGSNWPIRIPLTGYATRNSPAVADIDGDGIIEIVYAITEYWTSKIFVYEPDGRIKIGWPVTSGSNGKTLIFASSPVIANLDGGNDLEIIIAVGDAFDYKCGTPEKKLYIYKQDGRLLPGWPKGLTCSPWITPAVGDLDANGDLEIVVSTIDQSANLTDVVSAVVQIFNHDGTIFPGWPRNIKVPTAPPVLADIDGNDGGKLEIVMESAGWNRRLGIFDRLRIEVFNHDGTYVPGWPYESFNNGNGASWATPIAVGDIDGDNDLEIVATELAYNPRLRVFNHDGSILSGWENVSIRSNIAGYVSAPIIADLDNDQKSEILIWSFSNPNQLYGFHYNGFPIKDFPKPLPSDLYTFFPTAPVAGDFDGDGKVDVFLLDNDHKTYLMYLWEFSGQATSSALQWPMFHHDPQHTGKY